MRFTAAAFLCFGLLPATLGAALADDATAMGSAGFSIAVPQGWAEKASLEQLALKGFRQADPSDAAQAFAWGNAQSTEFLLVQVTSSAVAIPDGQFRTDLDALQKSVPRGMGATDAALAITDDGTVMTGKFEHADKSIDTLAMTKGLIDSSHHLRAFSVTCLMVQPATQTARQQCGALLDSFAITLDKATFLPLEQK